MKHCAWLRNPAPVGRWKKSPYSPSVSWEAQEESQLQVFFPSIHSNYRLHMRHRSSNSKAGPRMSWLVRTEVLAYLEFQRSGGAVHGSIVQILRWKMKWIEITHYSWWYNFLIFINCTILYCCTIKTSDCWWLLYIYIYLFIIVMTWRNMIIIDGGWW